MSLLFCSEDGRQGLELSTEAVVAIQEQALLKHPHETGGILLGYYSTNLRMATAVVAIPPPPDSKHGPFNFERGTKGLKELLARYKKLTPSLHYLGEWHTHPAYTAKASGLDVRQMRCSALRRLYGAKSPILLVVGGVPPDKLQWQASTHKAWCAPTYLDLF